MIEKESQVFQEKKEKEQIKMQQKQVKKIDKTEEKKDIEEEKPINKQYQEKTEDKEKKEEIKEKKEEKTTIAKKTEQKKVEKDYAYVLGKDLSISTKQSKDVCRFIKNKNPNMAVTLLEKVIKQEIAIPYRGEIPHKKLTGGFSGGRYPIKISKIFIKLLKNLIANAKNNGLDTEKIKITVAIPNKASRPIKPTRIAYGRKKFKRTHLYLEVRHDLDSDKKEKTKKINKNKK